jgi:hypothetical protein
MKNRDGHGNRMSNPRDTYNAPAPGGAWSGSAIVAGVVNVLIVLGVMIYGATKTVADAANITTSAPPTTGQGS